MINNISLKGQAAFLSCEDGGEESAIFGYRMNNLLEQKTVSSSVSSRNRFPSYVRKLLYPLTWVIVVAALFAGVALLASDVFATVLPHAPVSASPLLLIGAAYLGFQALTRPKPLDLLKALIVSAAFILWGIDQLLPQGWFATTLGDVVIALYVLDLGWMMLASLSKRR